MVIKQIDRFPFREFMVVVAFTGVHYIAIGRDKQNREVAKVTSGDIDDVKHDIKSKLLKLSETFVDYPSAIKLFLRAYPKGFTDPFYYHDERNYKLKAHNKAIELLGRERLAALITAGEYARIGDAAKKTFTNLTFPNEAMKFSDFLKDGKGVHDFSNHLYELLYGDSFDNAFDRMAILLKPFEAAKWTILTYWPFIVHPDKQMFLKPETSQNCAWHLGWDFGYQSYPTDLLR